MTILIENYFESTIFTNIKEIMFKNNVKTHFFDSQANCGKLKCG